MFPELNNILTFDQRTTPSKQIISIFQDNNSDSSFLIHHFLSYFLKSGDSVCFLALSQSFGHYNNVCQKLGLKLKNFRDNGKLVFMEGLKLCGNSLLSEHIEDVSLEGENSEYEKLFSSILTDSSKDSLRPIYSYLASKVQDLQHAGSKVHIVIDDMSILLSLGVSVKAVMVLIDYLNSLVMRTNCGTLVVRGLMDDEAEEDEMVGKYLCYKSNLTLTTHGLASGYCKDVHGQMNIIIKEPYQGHPHIQKRVKMQYKVLDKNVNFFASGTSAAVL